MITSRTLAQSSQRSIWLVLAVLIGVASVAWTSNRPIRFRNLSLEDGLSQASVLCAVQDRVGFMWFGTEDGLNRYDGRSMTRYVNDPSDPTSIGGDYIVAMAAAGDGDLWIATNGGGLSRWSHRTDTFVVHRHEPDRPGSLSSNLLRTLAVADDGTLWIGTRDAGIDRLDPETGEVRHFRHDPTNLLTVADDHIYALLIDRNGAVWAGTDQGLDRLDPATGEFTHFHHDAAVAASLGDDRVRALYQDHRGRLWVGTYGGGLNRMDGAWGDFVRFRHDPSDPASISHDRVRTIFEDRAGRLWIGTVEGLNLWEANGERFTSYRRDPANPGSLPSDDVTCLYEDQGGVLWIGTQAGGVSSWNPTTWSFGHIAESPAEGNGLNHPHVTAISQDPAGRLWIGTFGGGLDVIDRGAGRAEHHRHTAGKPGTISSDRVMAVLHDRTGNPWIGTFGGGLNSYDSRTGRFTVYRHDPDDPASIGADGVMSLFEANDGTLWVGTFGGGLNRFDHKSRSFTRYLPDLSDEFTLSSPRVTSMVQLPNGLLWVGTDGGGLNLFDPVAESAQRFQHDATDPGSLGAETVLALHLDGTGTLWIGTQGSGLARLDAPPGPGETPRFTHYAEPEGLADDVVYGIEEDATGALWLSTNRGLSRFNPHTGSFRNYDHGHGLQADEFNFGAHFRSPDGELFFGGVNGFNAFYPGLIAHNPHAPPVVMTSFLQFNRPTDIASPVWRLPEVGLGYRDDVVSFEFAALDFASPEDNSYSYMLENFDERWIELGNLNRITFTDLDGGRYVLHVRAANNDGVWNELGLSLPLRVASPPWKTWWAYLFYALLVAAAITGYRNAHLRRLRREEEYSERLEQEVDQRTGELVSQNLQLENLNTKLVEASLTDSLTGLRNRRFLFEEVTKDIALVRRRYLEVTMGLPARDVFDVVFVMVDLDNFKEINDTFGHPEGDKVLVQMRDVLLEACRESDIVIRWGGDEFLVIGRDTDPDRAEALAHRIRSSIEEKVFTLDEGQVLRTTASVGFACFPFVRTHPDMVTWEQVLAMADDALYAAKHLSRNAWVGYMSTLKSGESQDLVREIRDDAGRAADHGIIEIRSSIPNTKWMVPDDIGAQPSLPGEH